MTTIIVLGCVGLVVAATVAGRTDTATEPVSPHVNEKQLNNLLSQSTQAGPTAYQGIDPDRPEDGANWLAQVRAAGVSPELSAGLSADPAEGSDEWWVAEFRESGARFQRAVRQCDRRIATTVRGFPHGPEVLAAMRQYRTEQARFWEFVERQMLPGGSSLVTADAR
jgi:hypothetical protein